MVASARRAPVALLDYPLAADHFDEAIAEDGSARAPYRELIAALPPKRLAALGERIRTEAARLELTFGAGRPITVDPVPRLIEATEWGQLEAGLRQRSRALNAFIVDIYGAQRIFDAEVLPRRLLESSTGYEPLMRGLISPEVPAATVAGFDLVRDGSGQLLILEDNLRMPSGSAYAIALRAMVEPALALPTRPRPLGAYIDALGAALRGASPSGREDAVAIISDGPDAGSWFEHRELGRALGVPVISPRELESSRGRIFARIGRARRPLDVLYRRLDQDRLSEPGGALTALGELLWAPLRSGRLRTLNAFGTGVADDKLVHAYGGRLINFYLGEEPLLGSVPSLDLGEEGERASALGRLDQLVIKPREGFGGRGVTIMARATETERRRAIGILRRRPEHFVAQEMVALSTHPTVCGTRLRPRHVDLRPFVISAPEGSSAMAGGLTRFAPKAGEMIVNSSRGGGCKDTWVLDPQPGAA